MTDLSNLKQTLMRYKGKELYVKGLPKFYKQPVDMANQSTVLDKVQKNRIIMGAYLDLL